MIVLNKKEKTEKSYIMDSLNEVLREFYAYVQPLKPAT